MKARKSIGIIFLIIAILFCLIFTIKSNLRVDVKDYFDLSFKSYFSLSFLREITPLIICVILFYGGILLIFKPSKSNSVLSLFGFTVLEEIIFYWFNIITLDFSIYVISIFLCCALLALWIAFSSKVNLKRQSFKEGLSSLILGTLINLFSYYI